tara:strand:+ start:231 stop:413 length:183 start_codon:yes stop_codon:yes gene_type:complete
MNLFAVDSNIFEKKLREVINQATSLSPYSKANILLCLEEELREEEEVMSVGKEGMWETES